MVSHTQVYGSTSTLPRLNSAVSRSVFSKVYSNWSVKSHSPRTKRCTLWRAKSAVITSAVYTPVPPRVRKPGRQSSMRHAHTCSSRYMVVPR